MRVMLLVTDLERGGTPLRLAGLARRLRHLGVDAWLGCLAPPGPISIELDAAGVPTFACRARGPTDLPALVRLSRQVRMLRPDLIHATLMHANVAARLVGRIQHVPVVTSTATIEVERKWHRVMETVTGRLDRGHIVNSRTLAAHVRAAFGLPGHRVYVVPPALERLPQRGDRTAARQALDLAADDYVVAWAGRLDPVKRLDLLVRCAEVLSKVAVRFVLAGEGPDRARIEGLLGRSGVQGKVRLSGWQDDLGPLFSAADALLFPSRTEGLPNVVLQAMAFGLPVVGSDIPALRELTGDERRLRLVGGDAPWDYADALMKLRADPEGARALGARAATWAQAACDPDAAARAVLAVYARVLRRRPPAGSATPAPAL